MHTHICQTIVHAKPYFELIFVCIANWGEVNSTYNSIETKHSVLGNCRTIPCNLTKVMRWCCTGYHKLVICIWNDYEQTTNHSTLSCLTPTASTRIINRHSPRENQLRTNNRAPSQPHTIRERRRCSSSTFPDTLLPCRFATQQRWAVFPVLPPTTQPRSNSSSNAQKNRPCSHATANPREWRLSDLKQWQTITFKGWITCSALNSLFILSLQCAHRVPPQSLLPHFNHFA